jgi:hypothetical protein
VPAITITINREQRDGLYEVVRNHLGSAGDLVDLLEHEKDYAKAEQLGLELAEDIRLMGDLGWDEDEGRGGVELTIEPHDLIEVLKRLQREADLVLAASEESPEDAKMRQRFKQGYDACGELLAQTVPAPGRSGAKS